VTHPLFNEVCQGWFYHLLSPIQEALRVGCFNEEHGWHYFVNPALSKWKRFSYPTRRLKKSWQNNLHTILDVEDTSRERGGRGAYIVDVGGPHFHCKWIHSNPLKGEVRGKPCLVHETLKFCIRTKFQDWEFLGENFRKRKVSSRLIWLFAILCEETLGIFAISEKD
jgi:hypothetical protein